MKHYSYYILAALMSCALLCCKERSNDVIITGQLEGVEDGTVIVLQKIEGLQFVDLQEDTVVNGGFRISYLDTFNHSIPLIVKAKGEGFPPVWLDIWTAPGANIKITGRDKLIATWEVCSAVPEQIELNKYKDLTNEYRKKLQITTREVDLYWKEFDNFPEKRDSLKPIIDSINVIAHSLFGLIAKTEIDIMYEKEIYYPAWIVQLKWHVLSREWLNLPETYTNKLKSIYENLSDELKNSEQGQSIYVNLYPPTVVKEGDDMADADLWNLDGELCRLADYKGKYLLLDFWSAACGPCMAAMPALKEISAKYQDNLVVAGISLDSKEKWESMSKEHGITGVNLNDFKGVDGIAARYGVMAMPTYVIISPEGKIITVMLGSQLLREKIEELMK